MSALQSFLLEVRNPTLSRAAVAALVAPPLAMTIYGIVASVVLSKTGDGPLTLVTVLGMIGMTCIYGSAFAYLGMVLIGLPTFLVLKATDAQRGINYILVGTSSLPLLLLFNSGGLPGHVAPLFLAATPGCLVAGCWWFLASR